VTARAPRPSGDLFAPRGSSVPTAPAFRHTIDGDSTDLTAECRRVGPRRGLVEIVTTAAVTYLCPACVAPIVHPAGDVLRAREAVIRGHGHHVEPGEIDLPMLAVRHGPRKALVEVMVGDVVRSICLVCAVAERSRGYDPATVRADAVRRHAGCFARLGQWRATP
jgi:hypothetical protein